ncbi:carbon starvation protein A [Brachyspira hyodysenteriae]|uniref:carbon starvation CstA family protein n=2 Tax=Brachyspira hyodysenteriae TaxID=159 RepID=UPI0022CD830A|nr:carbon starvation protein A [Brachyspira hyodysenteriae]MCZ9962348.1 carbon starvation protein A [Brachyspira hyodysenteriae]
MNAFILLLLGMIIFFVAYITYGSYLAKKWGIDPGKKTPAHTLNDGKDYVPTDAKVLLGHHFSSIAGAGPITGPIIATMFGWLPVYLWIIFGCVFFGGVHDYGSLVASLRHEGKSIGEVIRHNVSQKGKIMFTLYAFITICLVVAAFLDITAGTFAVNVDNYRESAAAGTASMLFIVLALLFGFLVYRRGASVAVSTIVGVVLLAAIIFISDKFPFLTLEKVHWQIILVIYIILASLMPVWILLQPRDYLSSFLLYAMVVGGVVGLVIMRPAVQTPAFTSFMPSEGNYLFPILFITVACDAISGFHALVSSGTSAKQLNSEKDAKLVGYGAMLIEGIVAIVALMSVSAVAGNGEGTPAARFATGVATFMTSFGVPLSMGKTFVTLAFASFALTSLDSATRIGRYLIQELGEYTGADGRVHKTFLTNPYIATGITVLFSLGFTLYGYARIWPIFGSANQLLAGLSLLAVAAWIKNRQKRTSWENIIPLTFMFAVTLSALALVVYTNIMKATFDGYVLAAIAAVMIILAVVELFITGQWARGLSKETASNPNDPIKNK